MKNILFRLKSRLITGWNFLRVIRLALASLVTIGAWNSSEIIFAILGCYLIFQAAFNYGCCGTAGCDIDHARRKPISLSGSGDTTIFEEIK